jgi:outer membrane protein TolC
MNEAIRHGRLLTAVMLIVVASWSLAGEAELPGHEHAALPVDASLTLAAATDAALASYPALLTLQARARQAEAWNDRGQSWLADRPSMLLRYQSDRWGSNNKLDEYEAGIELPLWNWGARSASQDLGAALSTESIAATTAMRWEVAGMVRELLWNIALAENDHELAEQAHETAARLTATVERRFELGDVAERDVLLARSTLLEAQTALIEAGAALLDAERSYRANTGLDRRPPFSAETLSSLAEVGDDHPALAFADAAVARAEASLEVAERTAKTGTSVLVGARRERPAFGTELDDSIGITVSIPFGGTSHRRAEISAVASVAADARARRNQQVRELSLALHEAAHGLNVVRQNLGAAEQRMSLADRQLAMGGIAYEKGEFELIDLLKLRTTAIAARRQVSRLRIDENRQTALYNQAVGNLP